MLHGDVRSPHLRELLAFEAQRHGLSVRFHEAALSDHYVPPPFRREAIIVSHSEYHRERFGILLDDEEVLVNIPAHALDIDGETVGYTDRGGEPVPLGVIIRNVLVVFVSLEALADPESALVRRRLNGHAPSGNVLASVFDMVVSQAMPRLKANIEGYDWAQERHSFAEQRLRGVQDRITRTKEDVTLNDRVIAEKTYEIARLIRKNQELRERAAFLESHTKMRVRRESEREFLSLMKLAPEAFREVDVQGDRIIARTYPVSMDHRDRDYELGAYQVTIRLDADEVLIATLDGEKHDGFPHPHVSTSGVPCFGNIGPSIAKLLVEGQYAAAQSVILEFLRSYNAGDAYIRLENWDPDWDDERWESCFDNASPDECVDCEESDCPHYADRYERCWEATPYGRDALARCIRCRECAYHEEAEQICRDGGSPPECIDCSLPCRFAQDEDDMDACNDDNPEACAGCTVERCQYQGTEPDEEEDAA